MFLQYIVKAELGMEFVLSTNVPNGRLFENEAKHQNFAVMVRFSQIYGEIL